MLHTYRKTTTIQAEEVDSDGFHMVGFYLPTKEGDMEVKPFAYIATGIDGEHWAIDKDIFDRTYERID